MFRRVQLSCVLSYTVLVLAGCGQATSSEDTAPPENAAPAKKPSSPEKKTTSATLQTVSLHVPEMKERLALE
jgi:hypothetical protein